MLPIDDSVTVNGEVASAIPPASAAREPNCFASTMDETAAEIAPSAGGIHTTRHNTSAALLPPRIRAIAAQKRSYSGGQGQYAPPSPRSGSNSRTAGKCDAEKVIRFQWYSSSSGERRGTPPAKTRGAFVSRITKASEKIAAPIRSRGGEEIFSLAIW